MDASKRRLLLILTIALLAEAWGAEVALNTGTPFQVVATLTEKTGVKELPERKLNPALGILNW